MKKYFYILIVGLLFSSCGDDQAAADEILIMDYLTTNNLNYEKTEDGIYYTLPIPGNSENPNINSTVNVNYKGYFFNGEVFDENNDISFALFNVIRGWQLAIPLLGKGGSGTFIIPSHLAYGKNGSGSIPGNTVLIFDVTLLDFE